MGDGLPSRARRMTPLETPRRSAALDIPRLCPRLPFGGTEALTNCFSVIGNSVPNGAVLRKHLLTLLAYMAH